MSEVNPDWVDSPHKMAFITEKGVFLHRRNRFGDGSLKCGCPHCMPKRYAKRSEAFKKKWGLR